MAEPQAFVLTVPHDEYEEFREKFLESQRDEPGFNAKRWSDGIDACRDMYWDKPYFQASAYWYDVSRAVFVKLKWG